MNQIRRLASTAMLRTTVAAGAIVVSTADRWWPAVVARLAAAPATLTPPAPVKPGRFRRRIEERKRRMAPPVVDTPATSAGAHDG